MDDVFFRDLISHAIKLGADDAFVDEIRSIEDVDAIEQGRVTQSRSFTHHTTLYVKTHNTFVPLPIAQTMASAADVNLKQRIEDAFNMAQLADAWSTTPSLSQMPQLLEDDSYRFYDPFDDDPDLPKKRRQAFEQFLNSRTSERAPILLKDHAEVASLNSTAELKARQTITRKTQRRITQSETINVSSGFTRLQRAITHRHLDQTTELQLPDYTQIGYGIDTTTSDQHPIMDLKQLAQFYGDSRSAQQPRLTASNNLVLGAWATCVLMHETIHQSPYYLVQTDHVAIDSNRGILQCSTPNSSCSAYAIHSTLENERTLNQIMPELKGDYLYLDAPTFLVRHPDTSIDMTFSIVRDIQNGRWGAAYPPFTIKVVPHLIWKNIQIAFGPMCRISLHCQNGEPTFQSPGLVINLAL